MTTTNETNQSGGDDDDQERIQRLQSPRASAAAEQEEEERDRRLCRLGRLGRLRRRLRPLRREDLPAVRAAHAELFPIDYEEAFYEAVAEGTGGVFALGLFDDDGGGGGDEEEEGRKGGGKGPAAPCSLPALLSSSSSSSSSKQLVAFVTARLQNASHVDRTDAAYLGLLEQAAAEEEEARAEAAPAAVGTATATAVTAVTGVATAAEAEAEAEATTMTHPPPPQPLGPGVNLLGPAPTSPAAAYILTLGVSEGRRGEGIGRLLVAAVAERAAAEICRASSSSSSSSPDSPNSPTSALVYLHVAAFNRAAVALYLSCGFSRLATLTDFYSISTERRPDPARTRYDAHLFAMRIEVSSSSSSSLPSSSFPSFSSSLNHRLS